MLRALVKRQLLEAFSAISRDRKTGKNRSKSGVALFSLLYVVIFGYLGFAFYKMAEMICLPLASLGYAWLYVAMMGLLAIVFGVLGSVFNTYSALYKAKDNDMLLSMPIPANKILLARLMGVYFIGLLFELEVMVPAIIVLLVNVKLSALGTIFIIVIPFVLSLFVLTLSCLFGYFIALISSKVKSKIFSLVFALTFFLAYFYLYSKASELLMSVITDPSGLGNGVKTWLYPFYQMGIAIEGDAVAMLIFTAIMVGLFLIAYLILSLTFMKIVITNKGGRKVKYKKKKMKSGNIRSALLKKEFLRFLGSPAYMLNCGIGLIFMVIVAVLLLIKGKELIEPLTLALGGTDKLALIAVAVVALMASMNDMTAPSVSLEGKNIWLVQSYPVPPFSALMAKLGMQLWMTVPATLILTFSALVVIIPSWIYWILAPLCTVAFAVLFALIGLCANLKLPNLNWTNEITPIKQGMPVIIAMFGGWATVAAFTGLYILVMEFVPQIIYLVSLFALLVVLSALMLLWIKKKGAKIFANL